MKTVGIIAEYNPFHLGHKYLIDKSREKTGAEKVIVVMSGNSVQRGDFAIVDKFARAKEAVKNGADLVVELPFCFASQSAEHFARGAIYILNALGIDYLCFGSESNDLEVIKKTAKALLIEDKNLKKEMSKIKNANVATIRQKALEKFFGDFESLSSPNDILAIEYTKAIYHFGYDIELIPIKRQGNNYHDNYFGEIFSSATSIRYALQEGYFTGDILKTTTEGMAEYLNENRSNINSFDKYFEELKTIIFRDENLEDIFEVKEGIENLIKKSALNNESLVGLIETIKSKRYTYTRIRRILFNILIGLKKSDMKEILKFDYTIYTRILAFNDNGRKLLKKIKSEKERIEKLKENFKAELPEKNFLQKTEEIGDDISDDFYGDMDGAEKNKNRYNIRIINKLGDFRPENYIQDLIYKYDSIVNKLYYSKYKIFKNNKRVYIDEQLSPIYVEE